MLCSNRLRPSTLLRIEALASTQLEHCNQSSLLERAHRLAVSELVLELQDLKDPGLAQKNLLWVLGWVKLQAQLDLESGSQVLLELVRESLRAPTG